MKWQNMIFALAVLMLAVAVVPNVDAVQVVRPTIDVKLTQGEKVADARNNLISGNETFVGQSKVVQDCNLWCKVRNLLNFQAVNTPNEIPSGSVAKISDFSEPPAIEGTTHYTKDQIYNFVNTQISYYDLDGQVHSGYFPRGTSLDMRPIDPLYGNPDNLKSVVVSVPMNPLFPTPANCNWILNSNDGSGDLTCGTSGFLQVSPSETYSITVDTSNGLSAEVVDYKAVYAKGEDALITVRVENKIAEGILGGIMLNEKSLSYQTATNLTTLDAIPLKRGNTTFKVRPPTDSLNNNEIQFIPYVKVEIPYVSLELDPSAASGSGLRPVQKTISWYGTSDKALTVDYLVLFGEQIGTQKASSQPYLAPYKKLSLVNGSYQYTPIPKSNTGTILIILGIAAAFAAGYAISRRN